jgi:hypothetical protein
MRISGYWGGDNSQRHMTELESMFVFGEGGVDGEFETNTRPTVVNCM